MMMAAINMMATTDDRDKVVKVKVVIVVMKLMMMG